MCAAVMRYLVIILAKIGAVGCIKMRKRKEKAVDAAPRKYFDHGAILNIILMSKLPMKKSQVLKAVKDAGLNVPSDATMQQILHTLARQGRVKYTRVMCPHPHRLYSGFTHVFNDAGDPLHLAPLDKVTLSDNFGDVHIPCHQITRDGMSISLPRLSFMDGT